MFTWLNPTLHRLAVYASAALAPATLATRRLARPYLGGAVPRWTALASAERTPTSSESAQISRRSRFWGAPQYGEGSTCASGRVSPKLTDNYTTLRCRAVTRFRDCPTKIKKEFIFTGRRDTALLKWAFLGWSRGEREHCGGSESSNGSIGGTRALCSDPRESGGAMRACGPRGRAPEAGIRGRAACLIPYKAVR